MEHLTTARAGVRYRVVVEDCCANITFTSTVRGLGWMDDVLDTVEFTNGVVIEHAAWAAVQIEEVK